MMGAPPDELLIQSHLYNYLSAQKPLDSRIASNVTPWQSKSPDENGSRSAPSDIPSDVIVQFLFLTRAVSPALFKCNGHVARVC
jgi:hypothetical protein